MRYSRLLIPTLRDDPSEAEAPSHKLMLRAGYVRQLAAGLYIYLPLAWRVMERVNKILRQEMNRIGAQELSMPVLHPAEVWQQTGRWDAIGGEMFRLKDRGGRDMCLGMTHEEIMTWLASREIRSYRELPQTWYQIQTKLRDEARPKSGVLRTREFIMKDSYSFDRDEAGLEKNYQLHAEAYHKIFKRCGLKFYQVESDTGMMGGNIAHEFMAPSPFGEDDVVLCSHCGYAANVEVAGSVPKEAGGFEEWEMEVVHTPDKRTVQEVSDFLGASPEYFIKSLLYISDAGPVLALVRGDHELHEKKLQKIVRSAVRPATPVEIRDLLGVEVGFIGPHGKDASKVRLVADNVLEKGVYISGANKIDHHAKGIRPKIHFDAEWHDIHVAREGEGCIACGAPIKIEKCIEIGNIFKLGTKYTEALKAYFLDEQGKELPIVMGSYGIGPARIAAAAIEQMHDKDGMVWPESIAPFDVEIIPLNVSHEETMKIVWEIYGELTSMGMEVLVDDRDERAGVKFKDADLIGIPKHIIVGERNLKEGLIELKDRRTREVRKIKPSDAKGHLGK